MAVLRSGLPVAVPQGAPRPVGARSQLPALSTTRTLKYPETRRWRCRSHGATCCENVAARPVAVLPVSPQALSTYSRPKVFGRARRAEGGQGWLSTPQRHCSEDSLSSAGTPQSRTHSPSGEPEGLTPTCCPRAWGAPVLSPVPLAIDSRHRRSVLVLGS